MSPCDLIELGLVHTDEVEEDFEKLAKENKAIIANSISSEVLSTFISVSTLLETDRTHRYLNSNHDFMTPPSSLS